MFKVFILLVSLVPTFAFAGTLDVTNNIKTIECGFHGWVGKNRLKLSMNTFVDPKGEEHVQRKVSLVITGVFFDDRYDYLLDSVVFDDDANTYTIHLYDIQNNLKSIVVKVDRQDVPVLRVLKHNLPHSHEGRCIITGS